MTNLQIVNDYLKTNSVDAWIVYDFKGSNNVLPNFVGEKHFTRKVLLVISKTEDPYIICHNIDHFQLNSSDYQIVTYNTWQELESVLKTSFNKYGSIIMQLNDNQMLTADSNIVQFVKEHITNKDIVNNVKATLTEEQIENHKIAMQHLVEIKNNAFKLIEDCLNADKLITEYDVQKYILKEYENRNLVTDSGPVVAVNQNAGMPHYEPNQQEYAVINKGDTILIDLWAKLKTENSCYADITWVAYAGKDVPKEYQTAFDVIKKSIELGLEYLNQNYLKGVRGCDLDDVVRNYIKSMDYDKYFTHRVGHSIYADNTPHGKGTNIDNYESCDCRLIANNTCFSIEPGIYTNSFGVREEINVCIIDNKVTVTAPIQKQIVTMNIK